MISNADLNSTQQRTDEPPQWVIDIQNSLQKLSATELDLENSHEVCICEVPESLSCSKREAFIPQFVGLGPYHHFRTKERDHKLIMTPEKKLAAAKRVLKDLLSNNMGLFLQRISKFGSDVHTFYHPDVKSMYKDKTHTLLYALTVDGLFLLAFITLVSSSSSDAGLGFSYFLTGKLGMPMFNTAGVELTKNALIKEVFKLENQIPFHVLKQISGVNDDQIQSESDGKSLSSDVEIFCRKYCPLVNLEEAADNLAIEERHHLLDVMYHLIVPKILQPESVLQPESSTEALVQSESETGPDESESQTQVEDEAGDDNEETEDFEVQNGAEAEAEAESQGNIGQQLVNDIRNRIRSLSTCFIACCIILIVLLVMCFVVVFVVMLFVNLIIQVITSIFRIVQWVLSTLFRLVQRVLRLLGGVLLVLLRTLNPVLDWIHRGLSSLEGRVHHPAVRSLTNAVERFKNATEKLEPPDSDEGVRPVVMIPSVAQLHQAGILFQPAESGVSSIDFDDEKCIFSLPTINLDVNSEVIIRNLVAYETLIKSNTPLVFTRYVELMRTIIETPEDVKLLVDSEIIKSEFRDEVIADLFNGMSKSIRPTNTRKLDKVIHRVNAKFHSKQKRKKVVTKYTSGTFFTAIGGFLFLVFTALQTYCSFVNCSASRASKLAILPPDGEYYGRNGYFISPI